MKFEFDSLDFSNNNLSEDEELELFISGGISGARITDPFSKEADEHAERYYKEIRKFSTDVQKIVNNLNGMYSYEEILKIKEYLFINEQVLSDGVRQFDPDCSIAQSWQRLAFDFENVQKHDYTLLQHELAEMRFINNGKSQSEAHDLANMLYNYTVESNKYYESLRKEKCNNDKDI